MKKRLYIIFALFICALWQQQVITGFVSFVVPKDSLADRASLVLFIQDGFGNECIGTCRLDEKIAGKKIMQQDLCFESDESFDLLYSNTDCVDITHCSKTGENEIVVCFELDKDVTVLRVLLIKDNLFADNPFDICCIAVQSNSQQAEDDDFLQLVNNIEAAGVPMRDADPAGYAGILSQCSLYVKIYVLMNYFHFKRKISDMFSWLSKRQ